MWTTHAGNTPLAAGLIIGIIAGIISGIIEAFKDR